MKSLFALLCLAGAFLLNPAETFAADADCGIPPGNPPAIPDGNTANGDQIRNATRAVQDYASVVQNYLNCLQLNQDAYFLNMDDDQRERWTEDYNALADLLTETQNNLNEQIRAYNKRS